MSRTLLRIAVVLPVALALAATEASAPLAPPPSPEGPGEGLRESELGSGPHPGAAPSLSALQDRTLALIRETGWRSGDWGVLAVSLEHGDTLVALDPGRPLAPASNQKLFTSAAALHHLGPDFRFPTFLLTDGQIRDGILEGDLILYGTGDPALSGRLLESAKDPFRAFARSLREQGVHTVAGGVVGDGSFFHGPTRRPSWNPRDLDHWYAAPASALSFNENVVTLRIRATASDSRPRILSEPSGAELHIVNEASTVTGAVSSPLRVGRDDPDGPIELRGQMRLGSGDVWRVMTVSDPAGYAASVLRSVLLEEGIRVRGPARAGGPGGASGITGRSLVAPAFEGAGTPRPPQTLSIHHSPPVRDLLEVVNKRSHNLYAELLLLTVGRVALGDGSFAGGSAAMEAFLEEVVGIPAAEVHVEDGSGLSRLNRATPSSFVRLLAHADGAEWSEAFWTSLPEAGNQRELRRMYRSPAAGNLRAKTGTIDRTSALSGAVRSASGETVFFSIMANDIPSPRAAKRVEDDIGIHLASYYRPGIPGEGGIRQAEGTAPDPLPGAPAGADLPR